MTAQKKKKTKQNPQWLLYPIPPPYVSPPFQKLWTGRTKKERLQGLEELCAVTPMGTAVYMDTLSVAAHTGSAPDLCKYLCKVQRNTMQGSH